MRRTVRNSVVEKSCDDYEEAEKDNLDEEATCDCVLAILLS